MPIGDEWILPAVPGMEVVPRMEVVKDCVSAICQAWPDAVVEDTAACEFAYSVDSLLPSEDSELCIYRDFETARAWQSGAPGAQLGNSMIQVGLSSAGVRLIADDWRDPLLGPVIAHVGRWHAQE